MNNLLIDRLNTNRVALHEVGHYIIARVLGFRTQGIKVNLNDSENEAASGIILVKPLVSTQEIINYLEKRVQVLFSGALSEAIVNGKVDEDKACVCLKKNGKDDYSKARELIQLLRNIIYLDNCSDLSMKDTDQQIQQISDALWEKAIMHVESEYTNIAGLSDNLESIIIKSGGKAELTENYINNLPAIRVRFL
ncbi:hypothetical protein MTBBW1_2410002 [Desulfamplus magnetovallimortis]|uniref:Peptidase M41 domain-containing protein n=1 Tax=Desulfamplus magnetovallimortis TaxID=1246637 RepID=A0A1W1HE60_9BACT|nr:hypothetical protein [Desulfamplus magnetovallimortis]SLM30784.1 hypothetical protein MTBBW1_2410002 [Desulfamplus magnetovallimortis]